MSEQLIETKFRIYMPGDKPLLTSAVQWPREPGYNAIKSLIEPILAGEPLMHVSVLHDGKRRDMFVSEIGRMELTTRGPLPRNDRATAIYRAKWLTRHPEVDPESLPFIAGPAVLFERVVWF